MKYNRDKGALEVSVKRKGEKALVSFRDTGPGIKEEDLHRTFDRFYRADSARSADFSAHAGQNVILYTDAPSPFPGGDPRNDYFPGLNFKGNPVNGLTTPGNGPNTRVLMRFNVAAGITGLPDPPLNITKATDLTAGNDPLPVPLGVTALPPGVTVKQLTLNEAFDEHGRLAQLLGTDVAQPGGGFGQPYLNTTTETAADGDTQVWQIANLSADVHPIHFHLVNVQIISRQPFAMASYKGIPGLKGAPIPPRRRNEAGRRPSG